MAVYRVKLSCLLALADPLVNPPWPSTRGLIEPDEVLAPALDGGVIDNRWALPQETWPREKHVRRIAYYVRNGWTVPPFITVLPARAGFPATLNLECPHQVAAARIRGLKTVWVCIEGERDTQDQARRLLRVSSSGESTDVKPVRPLTRGERKRLRAQLLGMRGTDREYLQPARR